MAEFIFIALLFFPRLGCINCITTTPAAQPTCMLTMLSPCVGS